MGFSLNCQAEVHIELPRVGRLTCSVCWSFSGNLWSRLSFPATEHPWIPECFCEGFLKGSLKGSWRVLVPQGRKNHDSHRRDRIWRDLLHWIFRYFLQILGGSSYQIAHKYWRKNKKSSGEPPVGMAPRNCRFLSLVVVERALSTCQPKDPSKALQIAFRNPSKSFQEGIEIDDALGFPGLKNQFQGPGLQGSCSRKWKSWVYDRKHCKGGGAPREPLPNTTQARIDTYPSCTQAGFDTYQDALFLQSKKEKPWARAPNAPLRLTCVHESIFVVPPLYRTIIPKWRTMTFCDTWKRGRKVPYFAAFFVGGGGNSEQVEWRHLSIPCPPKTLLNEFENLILT